MSEGFEGKSSGKSYLKYMVLVFVAVIVGAMLYSNVSEEKEVTTSAVKSGEIAYVTTDTYIAIDEESFEEMTNYFTAENVQGLAKLESRGQTLFVEKGTSVTVVDKGVLKTKVEINSTGQRGFITSDMIGK